MTGWWIGSGSYALWPLRVVLFHCTRIKERNLSVRTKEVSLLTVVGKIYEGILVDRVRRMIWGLIDNEQGGFREGRGCVDQIFILKQIGEKAREKKRRMYVGFINLEKSYDRNNREALWQMLRMYDGGKQIGEKVKEKKRRVYVDLKIWRRCTIGLTGKVCGKC